MDTMERPSRFGFVFYALVGLYCAWILSLPVFPSQDGPLHLYYAYVFGQLLAHSSTYSHYFYIGHYLPPYALQYYTLVLLMKFMPAVWAEKVFVCVIVVLFASGVRQLARTVGPSGDVISLFIIPLLLNWPLAMGFHNFCLSLALGIWALKFWCEAAISGKMSARIGYIGLCVLMAVTHPVPLGLVLAFAAIELALRSYIEFKKAILERSALMRDVATYLVSCLPVAYVLQFRASPATSAADAPHLSLFSNFMVYAKLHPLSMFGSNSLSTIVYRLGCYILLLFALGCAVRGLQENENAADGKQRLLALTWLITALAFGIALPLIPDHVSGAGFVAHRLLIVVWIGALCCASFYRLANSQMLYGVAIVASLGSLAVLAMAEARIRPLARQIGTMEYSRVEVPPNQVGLLLDVAPATIEGHVDKALCKPLSFDACLWNGTRYLRRAGSILSDSPWTDVSYIPLKSHSNLAPPELPLDKPDQITGRLLQSAPLRSQLLSTVDFILLEDWERVTHLQGQMQTLLGAHAQDWSCHNHQWYVVCNRQTTIAK